MNAWPAVLPFTAHPRRHNPKGQTFLGGSEHSGSKGHGSMPAPVRQKMDSTSKQHFSLDGFIQMTLSKPESRGMLHTDISGNKPQASG